MVGFTGCDTVCGDPRAGSLVQLSRSICAHGGSGRTRRTSRLTRSKPFLEGHLGNNA